MNQIFKIQLKQRPTQFTAKTEWNMRKGFEHKPRSLHPHKQRPAATSKGRDWFGKNLFTTFADLALLYTINSHLGEVGGRHFPFPPLVHSSPLAELPSFSYRVSSFSLLYFDCYVKLAFILILMSVFQLL